MGSNAILFVGALGDVFVACSMYPDAVLTRIRMQQIPGKRYVLIVERSLAAAGIQVLYKVRGVA